MSKLKALITCSVISITLLTGCAEGGGVNKEQMGTVLGGVAGGILGNQVGGGSGKAAATILGATAGAMAGNAIGSTMDRVDAMNVNNALENQKDNRATTWVNPNNNARYTVTPTVTTNDGSKYCREYQMHSTINGNSEFVTGRACRINGRWVQQ